MDLGSSNGPFHVFSWCTDDCRTEMDKKHHQLNEISSIDLPGYVLLFCPDRQLEIPGRHALRADNYMVQSPGLVKEVCCDDVETSFTPHMQRPATTDRALSCASAEQVNWLRPQVLCAERTCYVTLRLYHWKLLVEVLRMPPSFGRRNTILPDRKRCCSGRREFAENCLFRDADHQPLFQR